MPDVPAGPVAPVPQPPAGTAAAKPAAAKPAAAVITDAAAPSRHVWVRRFDDFDRGLHILMMTCFLGLAFTGIPLLASHVDWARNLAAALGGFKASAVLHRIFATGMLLCFGLHLGRLAKRIFARKEFDLLWGPRSMVPRPADAVQLVQHVKWFVGLGPRPRFDRFTYWEKFDYWAVFWGIGIIGGSGLFLWFPKFFSTILPGWVFNVALLIHGEEALLAVGFIFTIHFFNGHLRPDKFPMDTVIFTGAVTLEELMEERPAEYDRLLARGKLRDLEVPPPARRLRVGGRIVGTAAVLLGLTLVALTAWTLLQRH